MYTPQIKYKNVGFHPWFINSICKKMKTIKIDEDIKMKSEKEIKKELDRLYELTGVCKKSIKLKDSESIARAMLEVAKDRIDALKWVLGGNNEI